MHVSIWFSWPAWSWVNTSWLLLAEALANKWYSVYWDKEYASVIKWENNCFFLYISNEEDIFISKNIDYFLAYDEYAIEKNQKIYNLKNTFMFKNEKCTYKNTFAFWAALRVFWIQLEEGKEILEKQFKEKNLTKEKLDLNFTDLENWYQYIMHCWWEACKIIHFDKKIWEKKHFMFWNELIAKWWIASWLDFYAAYPMTPASTIIDEIIKDDKVTFYQWEDEIAVSMAMLWAKFAWKRAMCGTSWWWFALMTESIWFSNQAEIWWVYILSQRDWPSTGTPTFTAQSDLNYALNASFWDTKPIVFAPSTFEEAYNFTWIALNWSDQYQHPIIMLVDKQLSESYLSIDQKTLKPEKIKKWELISKQEEDTFKRYELTENWISPYSIPWTENTSFIATSYEHDEYWFTNEEPNTKKEMMDKRAKKIETFIKQEFNQDFYWFEIINPEAETFYITMGITRYPIENFIKGKEDLWIIIIKCFHPFDKRLKEFLDKNEKNIEKLIFIEMNQSWILEDLTRKECELYREWNNKITHQRKYNLYPFFDEDIL
jgi:2-oxoglutarate ferredoxin oxidoreductase subunit alpha